MPYSTAAFDQFVPLLSNTWTWVGCLEYTRKMNLTARLQP